MNTHRLVAAGALIACALSTNVHAEVLTASASVSITNLTFTLIDLDPLDGIAPSIVINEFGGNPRYELRAQEVTLGSNAQWTGKNSLNEVYAEGGQTFLAPGQAAVNTTTGQSMSEMTMSSITTRASTSLDTSDPSQAFKRVAQSEALTPCCSSAGVGFEGFSFDLGAKTAIRLQGDYSLMAQLQPGPTSANEASAWLRLTFGQFGLNESALATPSGALNASKSGVIDFTLSNDTTLTQFELFGFSSSALAVVEARVSPVPEPQTTALMLAGLGVAAMGARRRSKR